MPYVGVEPGWSGFRVLFNGRSKGTATLEKTDLKEDQVELTSLRKKQSLNELSRKKSLSLLKSALE